MIKKLLKRAILILAPLVFIACEKSTDDLGFEQVIENVPGLKKYEFDLVGYSVPQDSILTALNYDLSSIIGYTGDKLLGSLLDNNFGRSQASFVTQGILDQVNPDLGTNAVLDSAVLYLRYSNVYGDSSKSIDLIIEELLDPIDRDTSFYSDDVPAVSQTIGQLSFRPTPNVNLDVDGEEIPASLRVPLSQSYFQSKIIDIADGSSGELASNDDFVEYFNGLLISTTSVDASIVSFDLTNTNSRILLFYHNDTDTGTLEINFDQTNSVKPVSFNLYDHDYENYPNNLNLNNQDTAVGESSIHIQSMGGVVGVLKFPGLDTLIGKGYLVNRAWLTVPTQTGIYSGLAPSNRFTLRSYTDADGVGSTIIDFNGTGASGDGRLRLGQLRDNSYEFDITKYMFGVLNDGQNGKLAIVPVNNVTTANRTILKGGVDPIESSTLTLYLTKP